MKDPAPEVLRLDKWLWQARFFKSRTLAAKQIATGRFRVNATLVSKSHFQVKPEDVLTFPLGAHIRIIRILALGVRRGPASEARLLYEDLDPPKPKAKEDKIEKVALRAPGTGRPTKRERRKMDDWLATNED